LGAEPDPQALIVSSLRPIGVCENRTPDFATAGLYSSVLEAPAAMASSTKIKGSMTDFTMALELAPVCDSIARNWEPIIHTSTYQAKGSTIDLQAHEFKHNSDKPPSRHRWPWTDRAIPEGKPWEMKRSLHDLCIESCVNIEIDR